MDKLFTHSTGEPVYNDQASLTTQKREGYTLLTDTLLVEKLAHFNRERIPERVVHAKGSGAMGYFEVTGDISQYTCASFLSQIGKKTEVLARFSTVGGERGSADTERDPRGFAVKFYTDQGNFDIVGNNTPVFFIRDPIKFPDFIHTQKRNPQSNLKDPDAFWDFLSLTPESVHQVTILFSDRGTPQDFRHMHGFGTNTFMLYNQNNQYCWAKFHFRADLGFVTLNSSQAEELKAKNPDHSVDDLFNQIQLKNFPSWTLYVQIMTPEQAKCHPFDPFDTTKVWYHNEYPLIEFGKMVLNKNPENFFEQIEQAAFAPSELVPGIGASPDKMLQGRIFAYKDAQRYRLGANFHQIPVNQPKGTVSNNYQRDGDMRVDGNFGSAPNYFPNSVCNTPQPNAFFTPPEIEIQGIIARHENHAEDIDYIQAGELYKNVMNEQERANLVRNIHDHLKNAKVHLQYRQCAIFYKCNSDYGTKVAQSLGLDISRVSALAKMTQQERVNSTTKNCATPKINSQDSVG